MLPIRYEAFGGYEENRAVDLPRRQPADGEVLLRLRIVGRGRTQRLPRKGRLGSSAEIS